MEPRFGHDFSNVRVHTDGRAAESARAVNALAYTVGQDMVFAAGQYMPTTRLGQQLIAHELAHSVQQGKGLVELRPQLATGPADDAYEHEAEYLAATVTTETTMNHPQVSPVSRRLQRACGAAAIGSVGGCISLGGQDITDVGWDSSSLYHFDAACDEFKPGEEARLRSFAETIAPDEEVEIHGFASEEGDLSFNDNLSCSRAQAAARIFSEEGVLAHITLFNHGATAGIREDRRSVVIQRITIGSIPIETENCGDLIDSCNFYLCRERQRPCGEDGYYKGYGYKYCERFSRLESRLSAPGKDWVRRTRLCLMEHVDRNILVDAPCSMVKQSAFDSHPDCYVLGGVCFLTPDEWGAILSVIDPQDNDLKQVLLTGIFCIGNWGPVGLFPQLSLGAGGGYRGLMERDRQRMRRLMQQQPR